VSLKIVVKQYDSILFSPADSSYFDRYKSNYYTPYCCTFNALSSVTNRIKAIRCSSCFAIT